MPGFVNRGFRRTNPGQRLKMPLIRHPDALSNAVPGAPRLPRVRVTERTFQTYPDPPADWFGPVTEWVVMWVLTERLGWKQGYPPAGQFRYQPAIGAPGLNSKGFQRGDFLVWPQFAPGAAGFEGLEINPISYLSHPNPGKDIIERIILATNHVVEIFIDEEPLLRDPEYMVRQALNGIDTSSRRR